MLCPNIMFLINNYCAHMKLNKIWHPLCTGVYLNSRSSAVCLLIKNCFPVRSQVGPGPNYSVIGSERVFLGVWDLQVLYKNESLYIISALMIWFFTMTTHDIRVRAEEKTAYISMKKVVLHIVMAFLHLKGLLVLIFGAMSVFSSEAYVGGSLQLWRFMGLTHCWKQDLELWERRRVRGLGDKTHLCWFATLYGTWTLIHIMYTVWNLAKMAL